jgi:hypothetical protein
MPRRRTVPALSVLVGGCVSLMVLLLGGVREARAADTTVAPGATLTLTADVMLSGTDTFVAGAAAGARCAIHGAGHTIRSAEEGWTGTFTMNNCDVDGMGTADEPAIFLFATGTASIAIDGSRFASSGLLRFNLDGAASLSFRGNTIEASGLFPAVREFADSSPAFMVNGESTGANLFVGNRIYKSRVKFSSTRMWTVTDNILLGTRAGFELENASDITIRGNYSHTLVEAAMWNQVKNMSVTNGSGIVIEHNVFWGRQWLAELDGAGDFRYNLLIDSVERGWVQAYAHAAVRVHHNLMIQTKENQNKDASGVVVVNDGTAGPGTTEVFNNTFDAGGKCNPGIPGAVEFQGSGTLKSLRSNAFLGVRVVPEPGAALVRLRVMDYPNEQKLPDYMPVHLGYADFNLFHSPDSPVKINYGVGVEGKALGDPGLGANDAIAGGGPNQQVDPGIDRSRIPRMFPYSEAAIMSGATTVCQVLAYYRQIYTPTAGSKLLGTGDPADGGENNHIGAVGNSPGPGDEFGTLCAPGDFGNPAPDMTACKEVALEISGGPGTGGSMVPPGGVTCVCEVGIGAEAASGWPAAGMAGVAAALLSRRRRRRR